MKKYPKYKDSDVEWIGEIPEHWEIKKLKRLTKINPSKNLSRIDSTCTERVTFLSMEKVSEQGDIDCSTLRPINELWNGFTYFERGDIILAKITPCFENGKGAYLKDLKTEVGFGSTEFHVIRPSNKITAAFLFNLTRTSIFKNLGEAIMYGAAGQKRIPSSFIEEYILALPPIEEQSKINDFIQKKLDLIRNLINQKLRLIQLLEEEKTAIINEAVTKGLNPDVKMKDSGIAWLGEVPAQWERTKLKYLGRIINGFAFPSEDFSTAGVRVLKISNIQQMHIDWSDESFLPSEYYDKYPNAVVKKGEFVFALTRPIISNGLKAAIIESEENILLNQRNGLFKPSNLIDLKYLYYLVYSQYFYHEFKTKLKETNQPNISPAEVGNIIIFIPSKFEQEVIAQFLKTKIMEINTICEHIKEEIKLLQEYRTALINETVTGKIDVRGFGASEEV